MLTPFFVYLLEKWTEKQYVTGVKFVNLIFSNEDFEVEKLTSKFGYGRAYPEDVTLAEMSEAVYKDEPEPPKDWKCLTTARNVEDGYFGAVFWNKAERQVVVAHRGTMSWDHVKAGLEGVVGNCETSQMSSAASLVQVVVERLWDKKIHLVLTGHSLGGWLAQVTCFTVRHLRRVEDRFVNVKGEGILSHALAIDSPGAQDILDKLRDCYFSRNSSNSDVNFDQLDLNVCLSSLNLINTFSRHCGFVYSFDQPDPNGFLNYLKSLNFATIVQDPIRGHSILYILSCMRNKKRERVLYWPTYITPNKSKNDSIASYLQKCFTDLPNMIMKFEYEVKRILEGNGNDERVMFQEEDRSLKMFSETERNFLTYTKETEDMLETNLKKFLKENYKYEIPEFKILNLDRIFCTDFDRLVGYVRNLSLQYSGQFENMIELGKGRTEFLYNTRHVENKNYFRENFLYDGEIFDPMEEIDAFIKSDSSIITLRTNTSSKLESLRVLNSLPEYSRFLTLKQLGELGKRIYILNVLQKEWVKVDKLLVIECFEKDSYGEKLLENIKRDIKKTVKKIIIIQPKEEFNETNISECINILEPNWNNIKEERKTDILEIEIKFQGQSKTLECIEKFLGENDLFNNLTIKELENILTVGTCCIGCRPFSFQAFGPISNYYVELNVGELENILNANTNINILVNEQLKLLNDERIIKISGLFEEHIQRLEPDKTYYYVENKMENLKENDGIYILRNVYDPLCYEPRKFKVKSRQMDSKFCSPKIYQQMQETIVLEQSEKNGNIQKSEYIVYGKYDDYQKMKNEKKIVHFIKKLEDKYFWQESHGNIINLRGFLKFSEFKSCPEKEFADQMIEEGKQIIIIADEAGMGKSTTLSHLFKYIKQADEMRWVIKICLKDYGNDVINITSIEEAIGLLMKVEGGDQPLHHYLLRQSLQAKKRRIKIFLLFDGFDEVTDKQGVLSSLVYLKNNTKAQIWVTTRKRCQEELEAQLCELAVYLEPLQENEEIKVLKLLLMKRLAYKSEPENYERIASELLKNISSRDGKVKNLLGVPLLIRILGEVYSVKDNSNMFQLFEHFLNSKFEAYIKSSYSPHKINKVHKEWIMMKLTEACYKLCQRGRKTMIGNYEKLKEYEIHEICTLGLVHKTKSFKFIHETISEFFFAKLLHSNLRLCPSIEKNGLNQYFLYQNYKVIRLFLNDIYEAYETDETDHFRLESQEFSEKWSKNQMDLINDRGQTALHVLVEEGLDRLLREVLGAGCSTSVITVRDHNDDTALNVALNSEKNNLIHTIISAVQGHDLREVLAAAGLRSKADIGLVLFKDDFFDKYPGTVQILREILALLEKFEPLFKSVRSKKVEETKMILEGVQDEIFIKYLLMARDGEQGNTMLHLAVESKDYEMVSYLLKKGAPVDTRNRNRIENMQHQSPLHIAAKNDHVEIAKELINYNASIDLADRSGHTPFLRAIMCNSVGVFDFLLDKTDLTILDKRGTNALMWAARKSDLNLMQKLLDLYVFDINAQDMNGFTALHHASKLYQWKKVELLINREANLNVLDNNFKTPLYWVSEAGNKSILALMKSKGADFAYLFREAVFG